MLDGTGHQDVLQGVRRGVVGEIPAMPSAVCVLATRAGRELCVVQVRLRPSTLERCHSCKMCAYCSYVRT